MVWKLEAITGEHTGKVVVLGEETLVGRHQDCTLVLQSAQVSRRHAVLVAQNNELVLQDLNSSNGTYVNGERITQCSLQPNDVIRIDQLEFKVICEEETTDVATVTEAGLENTAEATTQAVETPVSHYVPPASAHDEGMPSLTERAKDVEVSPQGMPTRVTAPKPAPIPEGVDVSKVTPEPAPIAVEQPVSRVEQEKEQQKNAAVGLISVIVLIILAILAWLLFK